MPVALPNSLDPADEDGSEADLNPDSAWAAYEPNDQRPWTLPLAGHLLRRAGFGGSWDELKRALADGPQRTVERLLAPDADVAAFNRTHDDYDSAAAGGGSVDGLRAWWLRRMIATPQPLLEKMTLFWHDHFAASAARLQNAGLMRDHLSLLRKHALGRFSDLLDAVVTDPAILLSLGADANRKASPNVHFARQVLERFTVGPGNFSERDARETARAFTGWFVLRNQLSYFEREHDEGEKTVLGRQGNFDSAGLVRILLDQPATARHLVRRLYRWLISETDEPSDTLIAPLAEAFAEDHNVGRLVATMLRSNLFFSTSAYRRKVKRPVEFALGIVRGLEGNVATLRLANDLAALGERLLYPPTPAGWVGGQDWLNAATVVGRSNLALALLSGAGPYGDKLKPSVVANKHGFRDAESANRFLLDLFLQGDVPDEIRQALADDTTGSGNLAARVRNSAQQIAALPEYHLA